jgi:phosphoserine phosphatase RsbU/P
MSKRVGRELTAEQKYELLRDISFRIRGTFDLREILNHLLDAVRTIIEYDAAGIFVLNEGPFHTRYHLPQTVIASIVQRGFDERPEGTDEMLASGIGIVGHVIHSGESVVVGDVRADKRYIEGRKATRSEITVPLTREGRSYGALNLESDRPNAFHEDDLKTMLFLASAVSLSIEKAMLHEEILEKKKMEDQLQIAREVQERLLPREAPRMPGYDLAAVCLPTHEIGGDYFDYVPLGEDLLGIVVSDVAGEGVPAALLSTAFKALFIAHVKTTRDPAELLATLSRVIPEFTRKRDFITVFYGILDVRRHRLLFANAGHNQPLLVHSSGATERLEPVGPALNIVESPTYAARDLPLEKGDSVIVYTDGVVEVFNSRSEQFGLENLEEACRSLREVSAELMVGEIVQLTRKFSGSTIYDDDFTLMVIKRLST